MSEPGADEPLFGGYEPPAPALPAGRDLDGLGTDARRTLRQKANVEARIHPLTKGPVHELAPAGVDVTRKGVPFTCGTCVFRQTNGWGFPKCVVGNGARASHCGASDVRAWWPACPAYESAVGPVPAPEPGAPS